VKRTGRNVHDTRKVILFVAGDGANSVAATRNFARLQRAAPCRFELEVVNVLQHYQRALQYDVLATPCLVQVEPAPRVMIVGTLQDTASVYAALRLPTELTPNDG
jgi:circadian clock protein KaiB